MTEEELTLLLRGGGWREILTAFRNLQKERDLAIAHDRQPYPTAWAYEQACRTIEQVKKENKELREYLSKPTHFVWENPYGDIFSSGVKPPAGTPVMFFQALVEALPSPESTPPTSEGKEKKP